MDTREALRISLTGRLCVKPGCSICAADRVVREAAESYEALKLMLECEQGSCEACPMFTKCGGCSSFYTLSAYCQDFDKHKQAWIDAWYESTEYVPASDPEAEAAYFADIKRAEAEDEYHPEGV